jgi:hypothetical protein
MPEEKSLVPIGRIEKLIIIIRGHKVILDKDLAELYGVGTRDLNRSVNRNLKRFPEDFMITLSYQEVKNLMFQFGTSSWGGYTQITASFFRTGGSHALIGSQKRAGCQGKY